VQHSHNLNGIIVNTMENCVRMNENRPQSGHDLIARAPHQRLVGESLACIVDLT
jgi:hypothetical protein